MILQRIRIQLFPQLTIALYKELSNRLVYYTKYRKWINELIDLKVVKKLKSITIF